MKKNEFNTIKIFRNKISQVQLGFMKIGRNWTNSKPANWWQKSLPIYYFSLNKIPDIECKKWSICRGMRLNRIRILWACIPRLVRHSFCMARTAIANKVRHSVKSLGKVVGFTIDIYRRSVTEGGCKIRGKGSDTGKSDNAVVMHAEWFRS